MRYTDEATYNIMIYKKAISVINDTFIQYLMNCKIKGKSKRYYMMYEGW